MPVDSVPDDLDTSTTASTTTTIDPVGSTATTTTTTTTNSGSAEASESSRSARYSSSLEPIAEASEPNTQEEMDVASESFPASADSESAAPAESAPKPTGDEWFRQHAGKRPSVSEDFVFNLTQFLADTALDSDATVSSESSAHTSGSEDGFKFVLKAK